MSLASKNMFAYLGNDSDGEEKIPVPVKTVDKANTRTNKRNTEPQAPVRGATQGNRRGGPGGNEGAFRDRAAGADRNAARSTDETPRGGARGGYGARARGGRGARSTRDSDDRRPARAGAGGSEKQANASWGAAEGDAELKDEQAGEAIAKSEQKEALAEDANGEESAEPEDRSVSYADYLVQQAEKKLALETERLQIREANEGSKLDKKWANAKPVEKTEEAVYHAGSGGKAKREREKKVKQTVDFDPRFVEPERTARGGARGGRGDRGGDRGRGGERGRGGRGGGERGRGGADRGDRGGDRGSRGGNFRGGRGGAAPINTKDESAFPSLGK